MFEEVVSKDTKDTLAVLGKSHILSVAYLAGGTALALRIGHRISVDLDFFTAKQFEAKLLARNLKKMPVQFISERLEQNTLLGFFGRTKFSLFFYDYPLLAKTDDYLGVRIASLSDIATMKLLAISDRGIKRDFIDLYFILAKEKLFSIKELLVFYDKKFKMLQQNKGHLLRSLVYFQDADETKMPKMLKDVNWKEIKKFFERETKYLAKREFGLN